MRNLFFFFLFLHSRRSIFLFVPFGLSHGKSQLKKFMFRLSVDSSRVLCSCDACGEETQTHSTANAIFLLGKIQFEIEQKRVTLERKKTNSIYSYCDQYYCYFYFTLDQTRIVNLLVYRKITAKLL